MSAGNTNGKEDRGGVADAPVTEQELEAIRLLAEEVGDPSASEDQISTPAVQVARLVPRLIREIRRLQGCERQVAELARFLEEQGLRGNLALWRQKPRSPVT